MFVRVSADVDFLHTSGDLRTPKLRRQYTADAKEDSAEKKSKTSDGERAIELSRIAPDVNGNEKARYPLAFFLFAICYLQFFLLHSSFTFGLPTTFSKSS